MGKNNTDYNKYGMELVKESKQDEARNFPDSYSEIKAIFDTQENPWEFLLGQVFEKIGMDTQGLKETVQHTEIPVKKPDSQLQATAQKYCEGIGQYIMFEINPKGNKEYIENINQFGSDASKAFISGLLIAYYLGRLALLHTSIEQKEIVPNLKSMICLALALIMNLQIYGTNDFLGCCVTLETILDQYREFFNNNDITSLEISAIDSASEYNIKKAEISSMNFAAITSDIEFYTAKILEIIDEVPLLYKEQYVVIANSFINFGFELMKKYETEKVKNILRIQDRPTVVLNNEKFMKHQQMITSYDPIPSEIKQLFQNLQSLEKLSKENNRNKWEIVHILQNYDLDDFQKFIKQCADKTLTALKEMVQTSANMVNKWQKKVAPKFYTLEKLQLQLKDIGEAQTQSSFTNSM